MAKTSSKTKPSEPKHDGKPIQVNPDTVVLDTFVLGKDIGVISITTYRDKTALDIRRYYFAEENQSWCPSSKGIRCTKKEAAELLDQLTKHGDAIRAALK